MLLRRSPLGGFPRAASEVEDAAPEAKAPPARTRSRIYEGGVYEGGAESASDPPPVAILRKLMGSGRYVDAFSVGISLTHFGAAVDYLIADGYAFERSGRYYRMRARRVGERPQRVVDLMDGLCPAAKEDEVVEEERGSGDVAGSTPTVVPAEPGGGIVLSDPAADLTLSWEDIPSMTSAILARRGSGKSYLAQVLALGIMGAPRPPAMVVFDPTGAWWGLLASEDGGPAAREIVLLGGPRGVVKLAVGDGRKVADLVHKIAPVPVILDLSEMAPAEQHQVCADFCERLLALPHFQIHVVLDEADEFAPQRFGNVGGVQRKSLGLVERLVMRGRVRGIGATLISLRPAVLSKNVLAQADALFLLRMTEPNDVRAVAAWLDNFDRQISSEQRSQCLGLLPVLPVGVSYYLRGGEQVVFRRFHVRHKDAYDSSRSFDPSVGAAPVLARPSDAVMVVVHEIMGGRGA